MNRLPAIVVGAGAAVLALGSLIHPRVVSVAPPPASTVEVVESSRLVCPAPLGADTLTSTVSGFVVPGLAPDPKADGVAKLQTFARANEQVQQQSIRAPGRTASLATNGAGLPPVLATGVGSLAPGLALDQFTLGTGNGTRGLGAMRCVAAGADQWFVGGGAGVGRTGTVLLANPEDSPATVDVVLWGPDGPLPAPAGRGVLVPARGQASVAFSDLAPGVLDFVVHIETRSGRVAAAIFDRQSNGLIPRGMDWVPITTPPGLRQVVTGIPAKVSPVRLSILSPTRDTTVTVRLLTPSGSFSPAGANSVSLQAGQVQVVDLTKSLRELPAAVELTSDSPIVAGAWYRLDGAGGVGEFAYAAGSPEIAGSAAIAGLPSGNYRHRLYLTNTNRQRDGGVVVTVFGPGGNPSVTRLKLPKGTTQVWTIPEPSDGRFSVVIAPAKGSPPFRGARVSSLAGDRGTLATGVPLGQVRDRVVVPEASPNLGVAVG